MQKIEFYEPIRSEVGVIMAFSKIHEVLGFSRLVPSSTRGFDIDSIEYNGDNVTVEFEYVSSNFIDHKHHKNMEEDKKYVVVCWDDDCGLESKLINEHGIKLHTVIQMKDHVKVNKEIKPSPLNGKPLYIILAYNPKVAGFEFSEWAFSTCFRVNTSPKNPKFAKDKLPRGSKILFYQNGYIIGGCTVVRYEIIERPKTEKEWRLYKKLTDFPATLYTLSVDELKSSFLRGHIFYSDFFDLRNIKIELSKYINKKMPQQGKLNLKKEEYLSIIGA